MDLRKAVAGSAAVILGGALLAGCGDTADDGGTVDDTMMPETEETMAPTP